MKTKPTFNEEEKELICSIINKFGSGQHPVASLKTVDVFTVSYLKEILKKKKFINSKSNLSELGKKTLIQIETKLL